MKIIAFSDWRRKSVSRILDFLKEQTNLPDLILYAGDDISQFNRTEMMVEYAIRNSLEPSLTKKELKTRYEKEYNKFQEISSFSKHGLCVVAGNDDDPQVGKLIRGESVYNVHDTPLLLDELAVIGLEGSTSKIGLLLYTEQEVEKHLLKMMNCIGDRDAIILSHNPPRNVLDFALRFGKSHIGSTALHSFIKKHHSRIKLTVCGHVHSQGGKDEYLGNTLIINCASHDSIYDPGVVAIIELHKHGQVTIEWERLLGNSNECRKISGIGPKRAQILQDNRILTIEQLVNLPRDHPLSSHKLFKSSLLLFKLHGRVFLKNELVWKGGNANPLKEISHRNICFFDAEYDSQATIFILGWMDRDQHITQHFAENAHQEKCILKEFSEWMKSEDPFLVAYSAKSADVPILLKRFYYHRLDLEVFKNRFYDIYAEVIFTRKLTTQRLFLPLENLSQKTVSKFFGFKSNDSSIEHGFDALLLFYKYLETKNQKKKEKLKQELLAYNRSDLMQLKLIWDSIIQLK